MSGIDIVWLCRFGERIRAFPLEDRCVEAGRDPDCEIGVHHDEVPRRAFLLQACGGTVYAYRLDQGPGLGERRVLPLGTHWPLGGGYSLFRTREARPRGALGITDRLHEQGLGARSLSVVVGHGVDARRAIVDQLPIPVGSAEGNGLLLHDRTVSRYHCRLEPFVGGVVVRDLGSRNGCFLDGHRVQRAEVRAGSVLRVGQTDLRFVRRGAELAEGAPALVAESPAMLAVLATVDRFARLPWPVLIEGESGVGKEHIARALHQRGTRAGGPFVAVNAGGMPASLIESELFGHAQGAFTGATAVRRGVFEQAHGGTLFLDEVAELPLELQTRLLRVLETWQIRPVGSEAAREVDVRLVCATHRDLRRMVAAGSFRADLYYRINRLLVEVPPLRKRPADIRALVHHFLESIEAEVGSRGVSKDALSLLQAQAWRGNARELRNVVTSAAALSAAPVLGVAEVESSLRQLGEPGGVTTARDALSDIVAQHRGNISAAARALGIPRTTLRDRLRAPASPQGPEPRPLC